MSRFLLCLLLMSPAIADEPTIDQMLSIYGQMGWMNVVIKDQPPMICIDKRAEKYLDHLVMMIAHRARGTCS